MGLLPDVPIIWYLGAGDTHSELGDSGGATGPSSAMASHVLHWS